MIISRLAENSSLDENASPGIWVAYQVVARDVNTIHDVHAMRDVYIMRDVHIIREGLTILMYL